MVWAVIGKQKKPILSQASILKRLEFCKNMAGFDWSKVLFSDEKMWRIRQGGRVRVFRRRGHRFIARYTTKSQGKPVGVMIWAIMKSSGDIQIQRCPEPDTALSYQEMMSKALPFINPRCDKNFKYQLLVIFPVEPQQKEGFFSTRWCCSTQSW